MVSYKYMVVKTENASIVDWETVVQDGLDTVRYAKDKSLFLLKYTKKIPSWYVKSPIYTKDQVLKLLKSGDW